MIDAHPDVTAWITYSPVEAASLMQAQAVRGRFAPRDYSVIAFSPYDPCEDAAVNVSFAHVPLEACARAAVELLIKRIDDPGQPLPSVAVAYERITHSTIGIANAQVSAS